jgi:hypothetical protein
MAASITEVYRSSNGDRWQLVRITHPTSISARRIPNPASGGQTTDITVADFLSMSGPDSEYAALRRRLESTAG